jgi:hypothetical protein
LTADEPSENAELVSQMYLADENKGRCRAVTRDDLRGAEELEAWGCASAPTEASILDRHGRIYRISELRGLRPAAELRWICSPASDGAGPCELVRLRVVVGAMESYEPARSMTYAALANVSGRGNVATDRLRWELQRLVCSHLVLNRGLREAVVRAVARGELSLSEIASRCGRGKSGKGQFGGDTSWLERRIGMRSEGGEATPRPWTHADVLALIARDGLGLSPNEVEV